MLTLVTWGFSLHLYHKVGKIKHLLDALNCSLSSCVLFASSLIFASIACSTEAASLLFHLIISRNQLLQGLARERESEANSWAPAPPRLCRGLREAFEAAKAMRSKDKHHTTLTVGKEAWGHYWESTTSDGNTSQNTVGECRSQCSARKPLLSQGVRQCGSCAINSDHIAWKKCKKCKKRCESRLPLPRAMDPWREAATPRRCMETQLQLFPAWMCGRMGSSHRQQAGELCWSPCTAGQCCWRNGIGRSEIATLHLKEWNGRKIERFGYTTRKVFRQLKRLVQWFFLGRQLQPSSQRPFKSGMGPFDMV